MSEEETFLKGIVCLGRDERLTRWVILHRGVAKCLLEMVNAMCNLQYEMEPDDYEKVLDGFWDGCQVHIEPLVVGEVKATDDNAESVDGGG